MNLASLATSAAERMHIPDPLLRAAIAAMVGRTARDLATNGETDAAFAAAMADMPIAVHTQAANAQHYELPSDFFAKVLGQHRKYSSCLYLTGTETLDQAERAALAASLAMAGVENGQRVLELGCGWGSFLLYAAAKFPGAHFTGVSNSASQRAHIEATANARGIANVSVITADMNDFAPDQRFDRIVSIEMFEHMANWRALLGRVRSWLHPEGRLFIHVFTHRTAAYRFDHEHGADWIAKYFFTGGLMPSHSLLREFADILEIEQERRWSGTFYEHTALQWLENFDRERHAIDPLLRATYGDESPLWARRWRLFFLAVAGLFGYANGEVWGVSQYRLKIS